MFPTWVERLGSGEVEVPPQSEVVATYRYKFGSTEFDEVRFDLLVDGRRPDVQRKPLEVLVALLTAAGEVVTHEELLAQVWDNRPTVPNVVGNAVKKLRGALGPDAGRIVNLPRVGFRFDGPFERHAVGRKINVAFDLSPGAPVPGRDDFVLDRLLAHSPHGEVWLASNTATREARVYKFCATGAGLALSKREVTLRRVLKQTLGDRDDLVRLIGWNFAAAPFFIESEYGGQNLADWAEHDDRLLNLDVSQRLDFFLQIADVVA